MNDSLNPHKKYIDFSPYDDAVIKTDKESQTLNIPAPVDNTAESTPRDEGSDREDPKLPESEEPINWEKKPTRGRGRPKLVRRTRERPKNVYITPNGETCQENSADSSDYATLAMGEIALESVLKGESSQVWLKALASEVKSILKHDTFD